MSRSYPRIILSREGTGRLSSKRREPLQVWRGWCLLIGSLAV